MPFSGPALQPWMGPFLRVSCVHGGRLPVEDAGGHCGRNGASLSRSRCRCLYSGSLLCGPARAECVGAPGAAQPSRGPAAHSLSAAAQPSLMAALLQSPWHVPFWSQKQRPGLPLAPGLQPWFVGSPAGGSPLSPAGAPGLPLSIGIDEDRQELPARLYWAPAAAGGGENRVSRVLPEVGGELVPFTG